jgi:hypothetical protein
MSVRKRGDEAALPPVHDRDGRPLLARRVSAWRRVLKWTVLAVFGIAGMAHLAGICWLGWMLLAAHPLGRNDPRGVFGPLFRTSRPPGISRLVAVGYTFGQSGDAWLTFRGDDVDSVLKHLGAKVPDGLTADRGPDPDSLGLYFSEHTPPPEQIVCDPERLRRHAEFYSFHASPGVGVGWAGSIAVVRPQRRFWVHAVLY